MPGCLVFEENEESLDERRLSGRSVPEDIGSEQAFFDATHHDMTCERQWHCELFSAGWQCLMSDIDL